MPTLDLCDTCVERLTIDGQSLATNDWVIEDLSALKGTAEVRGSDRIIPGANGVLPKPRRNTITRYTFAMVIVGDDEDDLQDNIDTLEAAVVGIGAGPGGTRTAVWTLPDASTRSAQVHVERLTIGRALEFLPGAVIATLDITVPSGVFT